jgi:hypothetical protein
MDFPRQAGCHFPVMLYYFLAWRTRRVLIFRIKPSSKIFRDHRL